MRKSGLWFSFFLLAWFCAAPISGAGGALAQTQSDAASFPAAQQASDALEAVRKTVGDIRNQVDTFAADDMKLADLKAKADDAGREVIKTSVGLRPRVDQIKARLVELGNPPAEGKPPEAEIVSTERNTLAAEQSQINKLTGEAEDLSIAITRLSNDITEKRRRLFTDTLFKRTDVSFDVLDEASTAISAEISTFQRTMDAWITFVWKTKRLRLFSAMFMSFAAALIFLSGGYRLFGSFIRHRSDIEDPPYISRLSVAFWSTMIETLSLAAFLVTSFFFLDSFNVLRPDIAPIVSTALGFVGIVYFVWKLTHAVFTPSAPNWRLVRVSNTGARRLAWSVLAMAIINGLDYLLGGISVALGSPVVLTVIRSFIASLLVGFILIAMSFLKPVLNESEDPDDTGRPWPRTVTVFLRLAGVALIFAALTGYIGLARFVSTQIVVAGAVLATMYIGVLSGRAVSKRDHFAETLVGRYLRRRYDLGTVALDQIGLAAGFGIYAFALMTGIPLILLFWGFQVRDLELWAYQFFTEIRIGNISISIVGILGGILVFSIGLLWTRWFQKWLDRNVMERSHVDTGVRNSVKTGIGYLGIGVAGLIGVSAAGINLASLALVAGALSLGIGFGLQNIVSNFVSGLILLVERPFKVGDWIVTGTTEGFVKRISVRATEIETFQRQSIIVPNSLLINGSVGNWTHRNKLGRTDVPVSVSPGNDPRRVMELLLELAKAHPLVLRNPEPMAAFLSFGAAGMDFELRVFLADVLSGLKVRNELRIAILTRFHEEGIEMPAPARTMTMQIDADGADRIAALLNDRGAQQSRPAATDEAPPEKG